MRVAAGSFGAVADTALAYLALLRVQQPSLLQDSLTVMLNAQQSDGSWAGDNFTTALVLQALHAVQPPAPGNLPDLQVTEAALVFNPASPDSGQTVNLTVTVFNGGTTNAQNVTVEFFNGDPRLGSPAIGVAQTVPEIAAGASGQATVQFDTSGLIGPQLIVVFADRGNQIRESDESNNAAAKTLNLGGQPDLELTASDLSAGTPTVANPEQVELVARVRNIGTAAANSVVVPFTEGATQLGEVTFPTIGPRSTGVATLTATLSAGTHTVTVAADPAAAITELNENNNQATITFEVSPQDRPDLAVAAADIAFSNSSPLPGETIQVTAAVRNQGTQVSGDFKLLFTRGDPFAGGAILIGEATVAGLDTNTSAQATVSFTVPRGSHEVFVFVDSDQVIAESSEGNNLASKSIQTAPLPDLRIIPEYIAVSHTNLDSNRAVLVSVVIDNVGLADASNVTVDLIDAQSSTLIGGEVISSVAAGASVQTSFVWLAVPGTFSIRARADPADQIQELNELNNQAERQVSFTLSTPTVNIFLFENGTLIPTTSFNAYQTIEFELINPIVGAEYTAATVTNEFGESFLTFAKLGEGNVVIPDRFLFATLNHRPGRYTVRAEVRSRTSISTHIVLASTERDFTVEPTIAITALSVDAIPNNFVRGQRSVPITARLADASNLDAEFAVTYTVRRPSGLVMAQGTVNQTILASAMFESVPLTTLSDTFDETGAYLIDIEVRNGPTFLATQQGRFQVEGSIRLEVQKTMTPTNLPPFEVGTVGITLTIQRVDDE